MYLFRIQWKLLYFETNFTAVCVPKGPANAPITPVRALVPILDFVQIVRQLP